MKTNSINKEIWKSFLFFSLINICVLLLLQVLFLNQYYKLLIKNDVHYTSKKIKKHNDKSTIDKLSHERDVCIDITDNKLKNKYHSYNNNYMCTTNNEKIYNYKIKFIESNEKEKLYEIPIKENKSLIMLSGIKLDNNKYVFINSSVYPIRKTVRILYSQSIIILVILLILSSILSFLLSRKILKPIVKISDFANDLAQGNYNKEIDINSNIKEINTLSGSLNETRVELLKTEELRRDLMANVSHDMKTPLTMIKAYTEMMTDLHKNNSEKREEDAKIIKDEVDRLTTLVDDILELTKMQSNLEKLSREDIEIIDLINNIINKFKFLEKEGYIFIFNHNIEELIVNIDKKKLEQVIYNLINNAVNYVGNDKQVIIDLIVNEKDITIKITDHGKGIKKDELKYIWQKYYKNSKKHKRNKTGTGLGLSIVKKALEMHNYEYGVDSKVGKGSTFWFKIKK